MLAACESKINSVDRWTAIEGIWKVNHVEDTLVLSDGQFEYTHKKENGYYSVNDRVIVFDWTVLDREGNSFVLNKKQSTYRLKIQTDFLHLKWITGNRLIIDKMTQSNFILLKRIHQ